MVSVGPGLAVLFKSGLVLCQFILRNVESLLSFIQSGVRQLRRRLVSLILTKSGLEINEVLCSVTKIFLPNYSTNELLTFLKIV